MPSDIIEIHLVTDRPDRRTLLAWFCDELTRGLAGDQGWEGDGIVVPWHVSVNAFEVMPARLAETVIAEWDDTGGQLAGIEFSGYLETDQGARAWGSLMIREDEPRERVPELETCTVERHGDGYRLDARLRRKDGSDA